jgi:hypothetical protein
MYCNGDRVIVSGIGTGYIEKIRSTPETNGAIYTVILDSPDRPDNFYYARDCELKSEQV